MALAVDCLLGFRMYPCCCDCAIFLCDSFAGSSTSTSAVVSIEGVTKISFSGSVATTVPLSNACVISDWMSLLLPLAVERGVCVITNMGASKNFLSFTELATFQLHDIDE
ncbi:uncharacterized protein LOC131235174 isoform X1 [Magnolia sinica]|uniref:uncharacterized protein LOC131235174 isoform X1 n=1 Tax=Magnolia sinica TaxID=86752 RepID=UPI00265A10D6|nr:uncharacterized protein LOC131235174 isoform X1 [Magnolia sinica]